MENITNQLIKNAQKKDKVAFELLYQYSSVFVYNVVLRILGNRDDASEVTQDVYVKVYNKLGMFCFRSSFKTWVYRIAVNTALNYIKKNKKKYVQLSSAAADFIVHKDYRQAQSQQYKTEIIDELLSKLTPDFRTVIVLREVDDLSYEEISKILRLNINTVKTRIKRARESLVALYKAREVSYEK